MPELNSSQSLRIRPTTRHDDTGTSSVRGNHVIGPDPRVASAKNDRYRQRRMKLDHRLSIEVEATRGDDRLWIRSRKSYRQPTQPNAQRSLRENTACHSAIRARNALPAQTHLRVNAQEHGGHAGPRQRNSTWESAPLDVALFSSSENGRGCLRAPRLKMRPRTRKTKPPTSWPKSPSRRARTVRRGASSMQHEPRIVTSKTPQQAQTPSLQESLATTSETSQKSHRHEPNIVA